MASVQAFCMFVVRCREQSRDEMTSNHNDREGRRRKTYTCRKRQCICEESLQASMIESRDDFLESEGAKPKRKQNSLEKALTTPIEAEMIGPLLDSDLAVRADSIARD